MFDEGKDSRYKTIKDSGNKEFYQIKFLFYIAHKIDKFYEIMIVFVRYPSLKSELEANVDCKHV
jgi:hypothetical protein